MNKKNSYRICGFSSELINQKKKKSVQEGRESNQKKKSINYTIKTIVWYVITNMASIVYCFSIYNNDNVYQEFKFIILMSDNLFFFFHILCHRLLFFFVLFSFRIFNMIVAGLFYFNNICKQINHILMS